MIRTPEQRRAFYARMKNPRRRSAFPLKGKGGRALDGNPGLAHAHASFAKVLLSEGRLERAVAELRLALSGDSSGSYHYLLYQTLKKLNRNEEAAVALKGYQRIRLGNADDILEGVK